MTVETGTPPAADGVPGRSEPASDAGVPERASGVQLLGAMEGSGYRRPPALVRRQAGQTLQLTPLLYEVLSAIDGERTLSAVAEEVGDRVQRAVTPDDIAKLLDERLRPLGLVRRADGAEPGGKRADPLLRMRVRVAVTDPERTRRLTAPFARLFAPLLVVPVVGAFLYICWWVLFDKGLASATHEAFARPGLLLLVFVVTLLSA